MSVVVRRISAPSIVCRFMMANSSTVSLSGLFRISAGVLTLPMSCIRAAIPNSRRGVGPFVRDPLVERYATHADILGIELRRVLLCARSGFFELRKLTQEQTDVVGRDPARKTDALDPKHPETSDELAHCPAGLGH